MLEEVQVTPGYLRGVIGLNPFPAAVGAAEHAAGFEVDSDIQALFVDVKG